MTPTATPTMATAAAPPASAPDARTMRASWPVDGRAAASRGGRRHQLTDWMGQLDIAPRAIDGVVTSGGKPLAAADVTLAQRIDGPGGAPLYHAVSDDEGRFHFPDAAGAGCTPSWPSTTGHDRRDRLRSTCAGPAAAAT